MATCKCGHAQEHHSLSVRRVREGLCWHRSKKTRKECLCVRFRPRTRHKKNRRQP